MLDISGDSVRSYLGLSATPPAYAQRLMHLWDSLAPSDIDTLLSPSLDSSWILPEKFDENWCTFEAESYRVYSQTEESYIPSLARIGTIYRTKVYAGDSLVYSDESDYGITRGPNFYMNFSCHSFGLLVEPVGCFSEGVHVSFPDGSHLEAIPKSWDSQTYIWIPSGPWRPSNRPCPT